MKTCESESSSSVVDSAYFVENLRCLLIGQTQENVVTKEQKIKKQHFLSIS
jgi:hypothetical protein